MTVDPGSAAGHGTYPAQEFSSCSPDCQDTLLADPLAHLSEARDPVCGMTVDTAHPGASATVSGWQCVFCGQRRADAFTAQPDRHLSAGELTSATR